MGGGSMNASCILKYLLKKKIIKMSNKNIIKISNFVGSDVILGLYSKNLILKSNGQVKKASNKLRLYLVVVKNSWEILLCF